MMDRLTIRDDHGNATFYCENCHRTECADNLDCANALADRLAAYEDTEAEPEEIGAVVDWCKENGMNLVGLLNAIAMDRVLILPCKEGDTVYRYVPKCKPGFLICPFEGGVGTSRCRSGQKMNKFCNAHIEETPFTQTMLEHGWGKTIFLTRAEAEAALKGGNDA